MIDNSLFHEAEKYYVRVLSVNYAYKDFVWTVALSSWPQLK